MATTNCVRVLAVLTAMVTAAVVAMLIASTPAQAVATTFTVNSAVDPGTSGCNATECTLREAINAANANAGADTINFAIPGNGPRLIAPTSLADHHRGGDHRRLQPGQHHHDHSGRR